MFHVAIDTGIFRKDPQRRTAAFRRLTELIDDDQVKLHIPDVVFREFVSGIAAEYRKHLNVAVGELNSVRRDFVDTIKRNLSRNIQDLRKSIEERCEEDFRRWLEKLDAEIVPVPNGAAARIVNSYFSGTAPFRSAKNRDDFPDALICETFHAIAANVDLLHVIVEDGGLAKAVGELQGVVRFASLDDFLISTLDELANLTDERLLTLMRDDGTRLQQEVRTMLPDALQGKTVRSRQIPDDNHEARLAGVYEPHEIVVRVEDADELGGGYFSIPFTAAAEVSLDYAIFIADWAMLEDDRAAAIGVSELNDHYYEAEEDAQIQVDGWLDVHVQHRAVDDEYITNAELRQAIASATYDLNEVEVTHLIIPRAEEAG